jgi:hypothetical protein
MEPFPFANIAVAFKSNRARTSIQRQRQVDQKSTLKKVKQLYLERRYKHCAALCEETLEHDASEVTYL